MQPFESSSDKDILLYNNIFIKEIRLTTERPPVISGGDAANIIDWF